jgi:hypothetical protein
MDHLTFSSNSLIVENMDTQRSPSLTGLLVTVLILIIGLVYIFISLNTEDALWFVPFFNEQPDEIFVNCYGQEIIIIPEDAQYEQIVQVINNSLSGSKNWDSLTLSDITYQDYQNHQEMMILELFYSQPVRIHSIYKFFSDLDSIVIPLDGRHAATGAVFGRSNNLNTAGALHYDEIPAIREFIESQGICTKP